MNTRRFFIVAALTLACTSCGRGRPLYPVSGAVMYQGTPAAGAIVFFQRRGISPMNEPTIMAIVHEDGSFTLACGDDGPGAPPGEYDVLIEWNRRAQKAPGQAHKGVDRLKGRYADPKRPLLSAVVRSETNDLPPFELTD